MPFYTWLRPRSWDDADTLKTKQRAAQKIKALGAALKAHINAADLPENMELPSGMSRFLRIATWNIREFDSSSYGYRTQESKAYIAEILSHFDLIALQEIRRLTALLADRAKSDNDSGADADFIALGDFNIVRPDHETMEALLTNEFMIPAPLQNLPGSNVKQNKFYDQIALWRGKSSRRNTYTHILPYRAGVFDFFDIIYRTDEEETYRPFMGKPGSDDVYDNYAIWRTHQISDHLPMWVELPIDFGKEYLDQVEADIKERFLSQNASLSRI